MKFLLVISMLLSNSVWAGCPDDIQLIKKGDVAVCDGVLLSPNGAAKADDAVKDRDYYKLINQKLIDRQDLTNKEIEIMDKRLSLYMTQSETLATELVRRDTDSKIEKVIYFSLGVLATGIAIYGASQLRR